MTKNGLVAGVLLAIVSVVLAGCDFLPLRVPVRGVTGLSAEERALAAKLPVHRERLPEGSYQRIGPVNGYSCQITFDEGSRVSEDHAIRELQRATLKAGANAVMEVSCDRLGRGQGTYRCFRSIVCRGIAVQTTHASEN